MINEASLAILDDIDELADMIVASIFMHHLSKLNRRSKTMTKHIYFINHF